MNCLYCSQSTRINHLEHYDYYHCLSCKVEYLKDKDDDTLLKQFFKIQLKNNQCRVCLDYQKNISTVVCINKDGDEKDEIKIDKVLKVSSIKDLTNKISVYLIFN